MTEKRYAPLHVGNNFAPERLREFLREQGDYVYKPSGEVRMTSETGGEKGAKDARFGGADPIALQMLALVYGMGERKYARYNYLKGYPWSLSIDALFRHLFAFLSGEYLDPESALPHMAHVAWHALTLVSFAERGIGTDDRAPALDIADSGETAAFPADPEGHTASVTTLKTLGKVIEKLTGKPMVTNFDPEAEAAARAAGPDWWTEHLRTCSICNPDGQTPAERGEYL